MKFLSIIAAGCWLADPAMVIAQQAEGKRPALESHADSVSYAFGASVARELKRTGLEGINASVFVQAISDVFGGKAVLFDEVEERELIMSTITAAREKIDGRMKNEASAFMERNGVRQGITTTASGLQFEVVRAGTGERPALKDTVTVHYKGQLSDGKVFDSSYDRGKPATFPLDRVIQGWREGLQLMPAGAHYRIYVPYELGYGERGAGQDIPPFSPLIFDVELISVQSPKDMPVMAGPADKAQ